MATISEAFQIALRQLRTGKRQLAEEICRRIIEADPEHADAWHLLGAIAHESGRTESAIEPLRRALTLRPGSARFHLSLGEAYHAQGKWQEAGDCFREALRLAPHHAGAHLDLGVVFYKQGQLNEAAASFREAVRLRPDSVEAHNNLGSVLKALGRSDEAIASYRQALRLKPDLAAAHNNLGNVYKDLLMLDEAIASFQEALRFAPNLAEAHNNLSNALREQGKWEEARASLERARELAPCDGLRIKSVLTLPVIYGSVDEVHSQRRRVEEAIAQLMKENLTIDDPMTRVRATFFFLAYQGMNDRDLQAKIAALHFRAAPALHYTAPHCLVPVDPGLRPIRVGFLSKYFHDHPIGKFYAGVIRQLSRRDFRVVLFRFPGNDAARDALADEEKDTVVALSPHLASAQRQIAEQKLDLLFYPDIGMDPLTYYLACARLARVQCAGSGHPVTTGIPTIDYFLSDVDLEPANAVEHYTEQLVRMRNFPFYFGRPLAVLPGSRADFGLDREVHLYVCAQTLFKVHPEFDALLSGILKADPRGRILFFDGLHPYWTRLLLDRFRRTIPGAEDRIRFFPRQSNEDFRRLISQADVLLDTIHFSGGTSSFEAFAAGTPIVTLPGEFLRGRVTYACYRKMGVMDCVAADRDEYVRLAVRLGTDPEWREAIKNKILGANRVLFENNAGVRELERFFVEALQKIRLPSG